MKLALAYNTRNKVELTKQSWPILRDGQHAVFWSDGSDEQSALDYFESERHSATKSYADVCGGADSAIFHGLTRLLEHSEYTHVGMVEADVLLDKDWLEPTIDLFRKGARDGLHVGAVSARSYVDRILIQRDGFAVLHNCGAGMIIFTRKAAEIVLRSCRTGWWPSNRYLFAQLSGIDLATYAAFRGNEQWVSSDWFWETQLARHGLACLALTPAKCQMIGQDPPLAEQGLELTTQDHGEMLRDSNRFHQYRESLEAIRKGDLKVDQPGIIHRQNGGMLFFPHQLGHLPYHEYKGEWRLKWTQGFGPFSYRAGPGGASLSADVSGSCSFLVSGGLAGAGVIVSDTRSGFKFDHALPPEQGSFIEINVPGGPVPRTVELQAAEGAVFYGLQTADPQLLDTTFRFDWHQLPEV